MKKIRETLLFFIGWLLSPFTWWNDAFVNMPLSYLFANIVYCLTHLPFTYLVIGCYWLTNVLGLFFMYSSGRHLILASRNRIRATVFLLVFLIIYSSIMLYLDKQGRLIPVNAFFQKYCIIR